MYRINSQGLDKWVWQKCNIIRFRNNNHTKITAATLPFLDFIAIE